MEYPIETVQIFTEKAIFEIDQETNDRSQGCSVQTLDPSLTEFSLETPLRLIDNFQSSDLIFENTSEHNDDSKLDILSDLPEAEIESESLIMNQDINFLLASSSSPSFTTPSFTYSKSEYSSSIFTLNTRYLLLTLPESPSFPSESRSRSFETLDPRYMIERIDLNTEEHSERVSADPNINQEATQSPVFENKDSKCSCDRCFVF